MIRETNKPDKLYYSYTDYQGSLIALTDESGNVVERYTYDPWGARRNPTDWTQKDNRTSWIVNRGYTGHEHIDAFGIINMNGRVYDPLTAQFFSPDPVLTDAGNWLDYNRYGYCLNNPFRYTDPSGYTWWAENGNMVISTTASIIVGGVVAIATAGTGVPAMIASGIAAGAAGGFTGGAVGTAIAGGSFNDAMKAGLQGAAIGVFSGAFGGAAGGLAATAVGNAIGSSFGGFLGGALQGAAGGAAGGFVGGSLNAWMSGASFGDGLLAGLKGAGMGALAGGVIGGVARGIYDHRNGYSFVDGSKVDEFVVGSGQYEELANGYNSSTQADINDEVLNMRMQHEFGVKKGDFNIQDITTRTGKGYGMSTSGDYVNLKTGNVVGGYVKNYSTGYSDFHISLRYTNADALSFRAVAGHELIHIYHYYALPSVNSVYSERVAYKYTHDVYMGGGRITSALSTMNTAMFYSGGSFWGSYPVQYQIPSPYKFY